MVPCLGHCWYYTIGHGRNDVYLSSYTCHGQWEAPMLVLVYMDHIVLDWQGLRQDIKKYLCETAIPK